MSWTEDEIIQATQAQLLSSPQAQSSFVGFATDTRQSMKDQVFVALRGDRFDAHDFLKEAIQQGAKGLIIDRPQAVNEEMQSKVAVFLVKNTLTAFQKLGTWNRRRNPAKIIAITGSNGKTSSKEFMAQVMSDSQNVHFSKGSFNNHWGVPISLLGIQPQHQVALIEMGMNHSGEITDLVKIAEPDVVACTMVGTAHIEHFGHIRAIAQAKEEIYIAAKLQATRIFNLDNPWTQEMYQRCLQWQNTIESSPQVITFSSIKAEADVFLQVQEVKLQGLTLSGYIQGVKNNIFVPVFGKHNSVNLMVAAAGALACGMKPIQIWEGLKKCHTIWGRNQLVESEKGVQILFDAYNANPESMTALLDNLKEVSGFQRKIGVFGEMLEMGPRAEEVHLQLGKEVAQVGFHKVYFYGPHVAAFAKGFEEEGGSQKNLHCEKDFSEALAQNLFQEVQSGDLIAVKGSRGMKMERMILPLQPRGFEKN